MSLDNSIPPKLVTTCDPADPPVLIPLTFFALPVEVGVYQSGVGDTILLSSEQWSTHARTIQGLKDNG